MNKNFNNQMTRSRRESLKQVERMISKFLILCIKLILILIVLDIFYSLGYEKGYESGKEDSREYTTVVSECRLPSDFTFTEDYNVISQETKSDSEPIQIEQNNSIYFEEIPMDKEWQNFAYDMCEENDVEFSLLLALIETESNFKVGALSADGKDYGLMQIREINHGWINEYFGYELDYKDPYDSVRAGLLMLSDLLEKNEGNITNALMAYNMGETGAKRARESGTYSTKYSRTVEERMQKWEEVLNNG